MPVFLHEGDCLEILKSLSGESVHSVVTDPPYGLFFMGRKWDYDVPSVDVWREVLRVLKPGGHLLSFAGTRTYHRMVVAIEDAGFEIRDQIGWLYGTGFPKSHNLSDEWDGWGTALKPAWEPIVLARKPLIGTVEANVQMFGTGAMNIDGCRVATGDAVSCTGDGFRAGKYGGQIGYGEATLTGQPWRLPNEGRWPANVIHDGSNEVMTAFPTTETHAGRLRTDAGKRHIPIAPARLSGTILSNGDSGSAARFFYCAKASQTERAGSKHPTVKPVSLERYLCKLVTPPGGTVLDPFAGTGTTGQAAVVERFSAILIEREAEYCRDIRRRLALYMEDQENGQKPIIQLVVAEPVLTG
jgi:DNA modification methylase